VIQLGSRNESLLFAAIEHVQDSALKPHQVGGNPIGFHLNWLEGPELISERPHVRSGQKNAKPLIQPLSEVLTIMGIDDPEHHDRIALCWIFWTTGRAMARTELFTPIVPATNS
jgi:hypothetical protein